MVEHLIQAGIVKGEAVMASCRWCSDAQQTKEASNCCLLAAFVVEDMSLHAAVRKCLVILAMTDRYSVIVEQGGGPALILEMDERLALVEMPVPDGMDDSLSDCTVPATKLLPRVILGWSLIAKHFGFASVVVVSLLPSPRPVFDVVAGRPPSSHSRALNCLDGVGFGPSLPCFLRHSQMTFAATS
jgi:hypothetical protein